MTDHTINKSQQSFAKDSIIWLRIIVLLQLFFLIGLITFIFFQYQTAPKPIYFPLKTGDQLIEAISLEKPSLTEAELLNWVTEAMIVSFSFNYYNYYKIAEQITDYFDPMGQDSYMKMLSEHKQIQQVVSKKMILSGRPTAAPRIVKDGVVDNRYAWEVHLPFILKFSNQQFRQDIELTLDLLIVRVPEKTASLGVKIVKIQDLVNVT